MRLSFPRSCGNECTLPCRPGTCYVGSVYSLYLLRASALGLVLMRTFVFGKQFHLLFRLRFHIFLFWSHPHYCFFLLGLPVGFLLFLVLFLRR